jgi:hypothetical protein
MILKTMQKDVTSEIILGSFFQIRAHQPWLAHLAITLHQVLEDSFLEPFFFFSQVCVLIYDIKVFSTAIFFSRRVFI